jgi:hypothetical protein
MNVKVNLMEFQVNAKFCASVVYKIRLINLHYQCNFKTACKFLFAHVFKTKINVLSKKTTAELQFSAIKGIKKNRTTLKSIKICVPI